MATTIRKMCKAFRDLEKAFKKKLLPISLLALALRKSDPYYKHNMRTMMYHRRYERRGR